MARRREDVDWYVEMSETLERRDRRRKWIVLGIAVSVPLVLMGTFVVAVELDRRGKFEQWFGIARRKLKGSKPDPVTPMALEPVTVEQFQPGDIIFSQLDRNGFVTSISHFFRELGPDADNADAPFAVNRTDADNGTIVLYRLRNVGTGEVFEFRGVAVKRLISGDWVISEAGHKQIRDQLQARMRVQIRRIGK